MQANNKQHALKRITAASCLLAMLVNLSACGYVLYPERKGQQGGRLDPVVILLDGAALLFGVLPGVVAFAVDITNGTIYLPPGGTSAIERHLSAVDQEEVDTVMDEYGQVWHKMPMNLLAPGAEDMQQVTMTLSDLAGTEVAAQDIVWFDNLAALHAANQNSVASR
ncbi:hypothetical protein [Biformimicrobium ophioploci]|uniref:Uncharacterized protein n=1 Tax=Biformimicrobium ophioploci TaxID=3036711 RepID=A0ABQ6LXA1_9GAMM|nr:hypothetical protein [Microbulbifer sp. NKW57]GMG86733.1 hypothetical protein MNKW57_10540 [Microbulbifer sp. NKW57]